MAPLQATFSDLESHFCSLKPLSLQYLGKYGIACTIYDMSIHLLQAFSNVLFQLFCTAVQQMKRFQLTLCVAISCCDRSASCITLIFHKVVVRYLIMVLLQIY